ncbi:MAG: hypothetical protein JW807_08375 [Spirochaetes bacterium]|nr:hypothetical protein [Spirochaetota bacterium]
MDNEKKTYLQQLADKIVEIDNKLAELKKQSSEAASVMKEDYKKTAADLKVRKKDAEAKLKELRKVGGEGWDEIRRGAEQAINDLSSAFDKALSKFKKPQE